MTIFDAGKDSTPGSTPGPAISTHAAMVSGESPEHGCLRRDETAACVLTSFDAPISPRVEQGSASHPAQLLAPTTGSPTLAGDPVETLNRPGRLTALPPACSQPWCTWPAVEHGLCAAHAEQRLDMRHDDDPDGLWS